jgi:hypothetical protein
MSEDPAFAVRDPRPAWLENQDRKRMLLSLTIALGLYAMLFLAFGLGGLFRIHTLSEYAGPVIVRLGKFDGSDIPTPTDTPIPAPPTVQPERPSPVPEAPAPVVQPRPQPSVAPLPQPTPIPTPQPAPAPVAPTQPVVRPTLVPAPAVPEPVPVPSQPLVSAVRGTEAGNSYDMTIEASPGLAGRSLYVPIALYMPLPYEIPSSVHDDILYTATRAGNAEQRMEQFAKVYEQSAGGSWRLKREQTVSKPAEAIFEQRPAVWIMLEESGYDVKNAEYKTGTVLRDITILFKLSQYTPAKGVILEEVYLERSSGMSTIDDAVLYGFKKAQFRNAAEQAINGRFIYKF